MITTKVCIECGVEKPLEEFRLDNRGKFGRRTTCKVCHSNYSNIWHKKHREESTRATTSWRRNNPEKVKKQRLSFQLKKYGLTIDQYEKMLLLQNNKCKICKTSKPGGRMTRFAVDHDKITGKVRGLLCDKCNLGIGFLNHDVGVLRGAIEYLA